MKQIKYSFLFAILIISSNLPMQAFVVNDIYYNITSEEDRTCEVTHRSDKYIGDIVIPQKVTYKRITYSVTSIGMSAFKDNKLVTSVIIPNSVISIDSYAFEGCTGLIEIAIPNSVTEIGYDAFNNTGWYNLQPDGILYLNNCCLGYKGDEPIGSIIIQDGTRVIADDAFHSCEDLTNVDIPNSVISIGGSAFSHCYGLKSVDIPNSVTTIGSSAFKYCKNLASVRLSDSMTVIKDYTFSDCLSLTSITIPNSIKTIGNGAFSSSALMSVDIPDGVTIVGEHAFINCDYLSVIRIGNGVKNIGNMAFCVSSRLKEVYVKIFNPIEADDRFFSYDVQTQTTLYVPVGTANAYKNSSIWNYFANIVEMDFNGVEDIKINKTDAVEVTRYDIYGRQLTEPTKGVNIIKMSDGTTRKEYVK